MGLLAEGWESEHMEAEAKGPSCFTKESNQELSGGNHTPLMDKSHGLVFQKYTRDFTHLQLMKNGITATFTKRYSEIIRNFRCLASHGFIPFYSSYKL